MTVREAMRRVARVIGDPTGQCYAAAEAVWHLAGKQRSGLVPMVLRLPAGSAHATHWFLRDVKTGTIYDPTSRQFALPPLYSYGRGCGFLTKQPSKRARAIIAKVRRGNG